MTKPTVELNSISCIVHPEQAPITGYETVFEVDKWPHVNWYNLHHL